MTEFKYIRYEKKDMLARITIDRPEMFNAITNPVIDEIAYAVEDAGEDNTIGVIVIRGVGEKAFSGGLDLQWAKETWAKGALGIYRMRFLRMVFAIKNSL